ncbi:MAG: redoxin domain-containing protein [Nitrospiria bacterium]
MLLVELYGESAKQNIGPEIVGIDEWLNTSSPITVTGQRGKVVIVDFWTYSCINCLRTIPYLNAWYEKYHDKGLIIIGIHTPEFSFERQYNRVKRAVDSLKINYPIGLDNNNRTWDAFGNHYWPHKYFFGPNGKVRYELIGEGRYEEAEEEIRELLSEAGAEIKRNSTSLRIGEEIQFQKIKTPEIFFGTFHGGFIGNPHGILSNSEREYLIPDHLEENVFYLAGHWKIKEEFAIHDRNERGKIILRYEAKSVNWVVGTDHPESWVEIMLDSHYLKPEEAGEDVIIDSVGKSKVLISQKKLYRIINNQEGYGKHILSLTISDPDIECYSFTFG